MKIVIIDTYSASLFSDRIKESDLKENNARARHSRTNKGLGALKENESGGRLRVQTFLFW